MKIEDVKEIVERLKNAKPEEMKDLIVRAIIDTMPDDVKAEGACTNPEAVKVAIDAAMAMGQKFTTQLMFLLISKPKHDHECLLKVPSLEEVCKDKNVALRAEQMGEVVKDNPNAPAATQRAARA